MTKIHIVSRVLVALVAALLISELLVRDVFLGYTPTVRADLADRLVERTLATVNIDTYVSYFTDTDNPRPQLDPDTFKERLAEAPATLIVKGVYAKDTQLGTLTEVHYDEIKWNEVDYRRKAGTTQTIRIPEHIQPPPPGLF